MTEKKKDEIRIDDRRLFDREGNPVQKEGEQKSDNGAKKTQESRASEPESKQEKMEFIAILFTYIHTALIYLGEVKDPTGQSTGENLEGAKQMIDILELMQEKTKGNLTKQEEQYLESALFDLRMRYVSKLKGK